MKNRKPPHPGGTDPRTITEQIMEQYFDSLQKGRTAVVILLGRRAYKKLSAELYVKRLGPYHTKQKRLSIFCVDQERRLSLPICVLLNEKPFTVTIGYSVEDK